MKKYLLLFLLFALQKNCLAQTYTFNGNGYWSNALNWIASNIPPTVLPAGSTIYISPLPGNTCKLDVQQTISPGANIIVSAGANFIVAGGINIVSSIPIVTTNTNAIVTNNNFTGGGNIINDGGTPITSRGVVWGLNPNPTIAGNKTTNGLGSGNFTSTIVGLSFSTTYYLRAYAINSTGIAYGNEITFTTEQPSSVVICNQEWTTKNLDVLTYRNGDTIPQITSRQQWDTLTTGAWCYYEFAPLSFTGDKLDKFYNSYAVNDPRGLAPVGWHIPCDSEWSTLSTCLGGSYVAGNKLKIPNLLYWTYIDGANNSSGFSAIGAGKYIDRACANIDLENNIYECGWTNFRYLIHGSVFVSSYKNFASWWSITESATGRYLSRRLFTSVSSALDTVSSLNHDAYTVRCVKGDVNLVCNSGPPNVTTDSINSIVHNYASVWATVLNGSTKYISERGFVWDTIINPTIASNKKKIGEGAGKYTTILTGLSAATTYYVRAYAINSAGTTYGNQMSFVTANPIKPTIATWFISNDNASAVSGGRILDNGGDSIIAKGVVWATNPNPTISNQFTSDGAGTSKYKSIIAGLTPNTTYYIRAYATNSAGIAYGNEIAITTAKEVPPSVIICNKIWMQKNLDVTTYRNGDVIPQVTDSATWANLNTGAWCWYDNDSATNAVYGKIYNWYAVNDPRGLAPEGWQVSKGLDWIPSIASCLGGNSDSISFAIKDTGTIYWSSPNLGATNSSGFTALAGGSRERTFYFKGKKAVWWTADASSNDVASTIGIFNDYLYKYLESKKFGAYVRCIRDSFVIGTLPVVATIPPSAISDSSFSSGGNIISSGGSPIISRGVVWNTIAFPDTASTKKTIDGAGTGNFISNVTGLASNTKYYVWAYATNSAGTSYGQTTSFTTSMSPIPLITTLPVTSFSSDTADVVGNINNNYGGPAITERGFVWSTIPSPTITGNKQISGNGVGNFAIKLTALTPNTIYYVRAYATNGNTTYYGNEVSFKTLDTFTNSVSICSQVWMKENLNVNTYRNGDTIPQVTDVSAWGNLTTGAWCWYNNDSATYAVYGKLYNWFAVNDPRGLAPAGWHIPSDNEWNVLTTCLGGNTVAGGAMKQTGTLFWISPNAGSTNSSGYTGLPGGYRRGVGVANFEEIGINGYWWSSTIASSWAISRFLSYSNSNISRQTRWQNEGLSVRCLRD